MNWLVDNNVPRGVTKLLLDLGHEVAEVRQALADNAPDSAVAAYAGAEAFVLVTHDRGPGQAGIPHLWLRTPEPQNEDRIREALPAIEKAFAQGSIRVVASRRALTMGRDKPHVSHDR